MYVLYTLMFGTGDRRKTNRGLLVDRKGCRRRPPCNTKAPKEYE